MPLTENYPHLTEEQILERYEQHNPEGYKKLLKLKRDQRIMRVAHLVSMFSSLFLTILIVGLWYFGWGIDEKVLQYTGITLFILTMLSNHWLDKRDGTHEQGFLLGIAAMCFAVVSVAPESMGVSMLSIGFINLWSMFSKNSNTFLIVYLDDGNEKQLYKFGKETDDTTVFDGFRESISPYSKPVTVRIENSPKTSS